MFSLNPKTTAFAAAGLLVLGLPIYGVYSARSHFDDRMNSVEHELETVRAQNDKKIQQMSSDLNYMAEKLEITTHDLEQSRKVAETLKEQNTQSTQRLRSEIATHSKVENQLRQQTEALQQDATSKFGEVNGAVQNVRQDLDSTKNDLAASRKEMGDVRDNLSQQIAHNSSELADLRRRGERDYIEFDINKSRDMEHVSDLKIQLKKTDPKKQKFDITVQVDDNKIDRKDRVVNEPLTFLVGHQRVRYEIVVNYVDKNRIRGYVSKPKDSVLSAEGPALRPQK